MKNKLFITLTILSALTACATFKKVHRLIDQRDKYIWTGTIDSKKYLLTIDSNFNKRWFTGKIIINSQDTLFISGFEKGSVHPTSVRQAVYNSKLKPNLGNIFIWTKGFRADTIIIENHHDSIPKLPIELMLFKSPKTK